MNITHEDDLVFFCKEVGEAQRKLEIIHTTCTRFELNISFGKTKTLIFRDDELAGKKENILTVAHESIENMSGFCYLGHMTSNKLGLQTTSHTLLPQNSTSSVICYVMTR